MRAMILAAGRGERMRPLTDTTPKPLLPAGGKPLIVWHIERLVRAGITDIVINHAWLGHQIEQCLKNGNQYGARITYSPESEPLETAGGIAQALELFQQEPFLVINGDIWCDWDPSQAEPISRLLEQQQKQAWLLLTDNPEHHPDGDFFLHGLNQVSATPDTAASIALTFTGIGIYHPTLFEALDKGRPARLAPVLRNAMLKRRVIGAHYNGRWVDVGTPERLAWLDAKVREQGFAISY